MASQGAVVYGALKMLITEALSILPIQPRFDCRLVRFFLVVDLLLITSSIAGQH